MTQVKFKTSQHVDFAIVGSGAAGGVIARELSQAGFSIVLFEQGPRLNPAKVKSNPATRASCHARLPPTDADSLQKTTTAEQSV